MSRNEVKVAAKNYYLHLMQQPDPMIQSWKDAHIGDPVLVRTIRLDPSYWIAPIIRSRKVLGYVEVSLDSIAIGHAYFFSSPNNLNESPLTVTRITKDQALQLAKKYLQNYIEVEMSEPVFVQDEARGRLAWMIEVRKDGKTISRIFITPGYIYKREGETARQPGVRGSMTGSSR